MTVVLFSAEFLSSVIIWAFLVIGYVVKSLSKLLKNDKPRPFGNSVTLLSLRSIFFVTVAKPKMICTAWVEKCIEKWNNVYFLICGRHSMKLFVLSFFLECWKHQYSWKHRLVRILIEMRCHVVASVMVSFLVSIY